MTQSPISTSAYECMRDDYNKPVILFLGAGCSFTSGVPRASDLLSDVRKEFKNKIEATDIMHYADRLFERPQRASDKVYFKEYVSNRLYSQSPITSPEYRMLAFLIRHQNIKAIYTTNQDVCLEKALHDRGISYNRFVYNSNQEPLDRSNPLMENANGAVDIYKLCGDVHNPYQMCFTTREIKNAANTWLFQSLLARFSEACTLVFIGYSVSQDEIGKRLIQAAQARSGQNNANIICVDITKRNEHKQLCSNDSTDRFVEASAEQYLASAIRGCTPKLHVKHAIFDGQRFGGVQTYYYSLKRLCERAGLPIEFSHYATQDFCRSFDEADYLKLHGFEYLMASSKAETVKAIVNDRNIDVLHAHNFISAYMSQVLGVPSLLSSHSLETTEIAHSGQNAGVFSGDVEFYQHEYYNRIPMILTLSDAHIEELPVGVQHYAKRSIAPFLRPETLNVDVQVSSAQKRAALKKQGMAPRNIIEGSTDTLAVDKPTISFFGRASNRKGLDIVQKVANILFDKEQDFQILFVGPDITASKDEIQTIMEKVPSGSASEAQYKTVTKAVKQVQHCMYSITCNVDDDFETHQKKMYDLYLASDIVLVPSSYEPFGYVALEAMAANRLVIANSVGGLKELLANERGILIEARDNDEQAAMIANSIIELWSSVAGSQKAKDIVRNATRWMDNEYGNEALRGFAEQMYGYYLDVITKGNRTSVHNTEQISLKLNERLQGESNWEMLLIASVQVYRQITALLRNGDAEKEYKEYYDVFWDISQWLKSNKSLCQEISIISVKELAQLLTELERALPKE